MHHSTGQCCISTQASDLQVDVDVCKLFQNILCRRKFKFDDFIDISKETRLNLSIRAGNVSLAQLF